MLLALTGFVAIKVIDAHLPAIQFFLNPTHKPTPSEEKLLRMARHNPSPAEFSTLYQSVVKIARPTPYVEIGRCSPYPLVARAIVNNNLIFVNSDNKSHTIMLSPDHNLTLKPKERKNIELNFYDYIPVPYGYTCDSSPYPVGILFMVEK